MNMARIPRRTLFAIRPAGVLSDLFVYLSISRRPQVAPSARSRLRIKRRPQSAGRHQVHSLARRLLAQREHKESIRGLWRQKQELAGKIINESDQVESKPPTWLRMFPTELPRPAPDRSQCSRFEIESQIQIQIQAQAQVQVQVRAQARIRSGRSRSSFTNRSRNGLEASPSPIKARRVISRRAARWLRRPPDLSLALATHIVPAKSLGLIYVKTNEDSSDLITRSD